MNGLKAPMNWGMPASPLPTDYSSLASYQAMPPVDYGLDFSSMPTGGLGFQSNGFSLQTPNLTGGMGNGPTNTSIPFFSTRDQQGYGSFALQGASALANLYLGMKQYGLAKDQLAFQKDSFNKQFDANRSLTNSRLEDRQARRVLENPNATGVAEYMSKWGVK